MRRMAGTGSIFRRDRVASDGTPYTRWVAQVSRGPRGKRTTVRRIFATQAEAQAALNDPESVLPIRHADHAPDVVKRFYSHVQREGHPKGCWEWTAFRYPTGYGHFQRDGKTCYAHRVALEMAIGRPLATIEWALHKCDNPSCVRVDPDHVYLGDATANAADRKRRRHREAASA